MEDITIPAILKTLEYSILNFKYHFWKQKFWIAGKTNTITTSYNEHGNRFNQCNIFLKYFVSAIKFFNTKTNFLLWEQTRVIQPWWWKVMSIWHIWPIYSRLRVLWNVDWLAIYLCLFLNLLRFIFQKYFILIWFLLMYIQ